MMKQERDLKLKIYPQIGFAFIFPFIFLYNEIRTRPFEEIDAKGICIWSFILV